MPEQTNKNSGQADLLAKWKQRKKPTAPTIGPRPADAQLVATSGQHRLWLLQQLYPENAFYHYGHRYTFKEEVRADLLEKAFQAVVDRHEVLRTNYVAGEDQEVRLLVHPGRNFELRRLDLSSLPTGKAAKAATKARGEFLKENFDLAEDLLVRALLIHLSEGKDELVLCMHHILGDRGSLLILNQELFNFYRAFRSGTDPEVAILPIQFPDFAHWLNTRPLPQKSLNYWKQQLAGELPTSQLPFDRPRTPNPTFSGGFLHEKATTETSDGVRELARSLGTTPNVVLLAAYQIFLARHSAAAEVTVGVPASIRDKKELEGMIGFLNETLVLKATLATPGESFRSFTDGVRQSMESALAHKNLAFDVLVQELQPERIPGANPLFQNMFVYNAPAPAAAHPEEIVLSEGSIDLGVAKFDLTLFAADTGRHFTFTLEFANDLFDGDTAKRLLSNYLALITDAAQHPEKSIWELEILGTDERKIRQNWSEEPLPELPATTILGLIEEAIIAHPAAPSVTDNSETISYAQLSNRADQLAETLVAAGVQPGDKLGLSCHRSVSIAVGILGILRAGAAYVPLDPAYPTGRVNYVCQDAHIKRVVVQEGLEKNFTGFQPTVIPTAEKQVSFKPLVIDAALPAYLIYTSGSTGRPKGVVISHTNLLSSTAARFSFFEHQPEAFLLLSSFAFDSSVAGIFWTLTQGGNLVIPPERSEQDMGTLADLIEKNQVTHTLLLPSLYQLLLEHAPAAKLASLATVMVAGEACSGQTVAAHFRVNPKAELVNEYGPTEGTVWCTAHKMTRADSQGPVPIGRPIPGSQNHLLDEHMQAVPIGVPGQLYITGPGVAQGYWQQPELTGERFINLPILGAAAGAGNGEMQRAYQTGDLASYRKNGLIDFLGRTDSQVKIRGFRVDPGEISRVLERQLAVREAVTIVDNQAATPRLITYYTVQATVTEKLLRQALREDLPPYMIPAIFMELDEFPRLPNGKVATKNLPDPGVASHRSDRTYEAPETETERLMAGIWREVLRIDQVGRDDNYFDLGGDSIRSIRFMAKAKQLGLAISPTLLFRYQTLRTLAAKIDADGAGSEDPDELGNSIIPLKPGATGTPLFCVHSGGGHVYFYQPLAAAMPKDRPVYAIQPSTLANDEAIPESIEQMAADYLFEIRKVQKLGPYNLLGTCFSNAVVLEIAHILLREGESIGRLIFVDSGPTTLEKQPEVKRNTLTNAAGILKDRNWNKLRRALYRRWFYFRQALGATVENEEQKKVRETTNALYQLYFKYDWSPVDAPLTLIRSTQFAKRSDRDYHVEQWSKLAGKGLDVRVTPGTHLNLFDTPQAEGLATRIAECLTI